MPLMHGMSLTISKIYFLYIFFTHIIQNQPCYNLIKGSNQLIIFKTKNLIKFNNKINHQPITY